MPTTIIQLFRTAFIVINNKFGSCHRSTPNYIILKNDRIERNDFNDFSFEIYRELYNLIFIFSAIGMEIFTENGGNRNRLVRWRKEKKEIVKEGKRRRRKKKEGRSRIDFIGQVGDAYSWGINTHLRCYCLRIHVVCLVVHSQTTKFR